MSDNHNDGSEGGGSGSGAYFGCWEGREPIKRGGYTCFEGFQNYDGTPTTVWTKDSFFGEEPDLHNPELGCCYNKDGSVCLDTGVMRPCSVCDG
jgi:hypothetical protein